MAQSQIDSCIPSQSPDEARQAWHVQGYTTTQRLVQFCPSSPPSPPRHVAPRPRLDVPEGSTRQLIILCQKTLRPERTTEDYEAALAGKRYAKCSVKCLKQMPESLKTGIIQYYCFMDHVDHGGASISSKSASVGRSILSWVTGSSGP